MEEFGFRVQWRMDVYLRAEDRDAARRMLASMSGSEILDECSTGVPSIRILYALKEEKFAAGDVVTLLGSPLGDGDIPGPGQPMTVTRDAGESTVNCVWADGGGVHERAFLRWELRVWLATREGVQT